MRTIISTLLLMLSCSSGFAQNAVFSEEVDSISYEQFQHKQFRELKQTVKDAHAKQIDFYYLRLRVGILAYNNKKYEYAIPQFERALEFFPTDTLSKEYLYYSYLFSDRKETAMAFATLQDISFQQKVGYRQHPFDFIGIGGGAIITDNISSNQNTAFKATDDNGKAERTLNGNLGFGELYFQNSIRNRLHINNLFSVFNTNASYQVDLILPSERRLYSQSFNNLNFQYNLGLTYVTKKQWTFSIGLGYYRVKGNSFSANPPNTGGNTVELITDTTRINSFLGSLTIAKRFNYLQPYLQFSASNLNAVTQVQVEGGILYYPLGNYNLYGISSITYLNNHSANQYVFGQKIGCKILKYWWSELNFNYGNMSNYIVNNGFLTLNTSNPIKIRAGLEFKFYIKKHFQMNTGYELQQRERSTIQFENRVMPVPPLEITTKTTYFTHLIKTNLTWNF